jgi:putative nucleotidyltransferase with HDIG domain
MTGPPRLLLRTLAFAFVTVDAILAIVFLVLMVDARGRVRTTEAEKLQDSARVFLAFETRRQQEQLATIASLAENPTLKAALDTYYAETRFGSLSSEQEVALHDTVDREAEKLADLTGTQILAILDRGGNVFVSAGADREQWPRNDHVQYASKTTQLLDGGARETFEGVALLQTGASRVAGATLRLDNDRDVGSLILATSLDRRYARQVADLSNAGVAIKINDRIAATTVPEVVASDLLELGREPDATEILNGEEYAVRTLYSSGPVRVYTLSSIDAAARTATRDALVTLAMVAFGAIILAGLSSLWLAGELTRPIKLLAGEAEVLTAARDLSRKLHLTGTSREVDALAAAFNALIEGLSAAEAETRAAYLGAIRALAAALDARDPYPAGHSERVSVLSVLMGRHLKLDAHELDVLRLGALLHDIGKIGLADEILRKPGGLTSDEFEQIKRHPVLGARILRQVPFFAPHLPIVELHHERPDGLGYPLGLRGDEIPLAARIVHVADAFDAMTSARAYRPARGYPIAIAELRRHSGTQFDAASVDALIAALPTTATLHETELQELLGRRLA